MRFKLVLDTNAYISAALSPSGPSAELIGRALAGDVELIVSEKLCDELDTRLQREKFRRWLTLDDVEVFVDTITLLGTFVEDRPDEAVPHVCNDPDDNFLVAIYQDADAHMLVSGDKQVLRIDYPGLYVYPPREALERLSYEHHWGEGFQPANQDEIERQIAAEGASAIISVYRHFAAVVDQPDAGRSLPLLVVPEQSRRFKRHLRTIREMLANRGLASRPEYASPDIAYLKLPPDPEQDIRASGPRRCQLTPSSPRCSGALTSKIRRDASLIIGGSSVSVKWCRRSGSCHGPPGELVADGSR